MPKTKTLTLSKSATPVKKISKKKAKDPNAPKRFRTAYILFSVEKRDEIKVIIFIFYLSYHLFFFRMTIQDYHRKKLYQNLVLNGKLLILLYVLFFSYL
jgi:hypothetical protein